MRVHHQAALTFRGALCAGLDVPSTRLHHPAPTVLIVVWGAWEKRTPETCSTSPGWAAAYCITLISSGRMSHRPRGHAWHVLCADVISLTEVLNGLPLVSGPMAGSAISWVPWTHDMHGCCTQSLAECQKPARSSRAQHSRVPAASRVGSTTMAP
jgi:hypothetical protein